MAYFDSESVSKETFMGVVGVNDTFSRTNDSLPVSIDTETVSVSVSKETLMCVEHNLGNMLQLGLFPLVSLAFSLCREYPA